MIAHHKVDTILCGMNSQHGVRSTMDMGFDFVFVLAKREVITARELRLLRSGCTRNDAKAHVLQACQSGPPRDREESGAA